MNKTDKPALTTCLYCNRLTKFKPLSFSTSKDESGKKICKIICECPCCNRLVLLEVFRECGWFFVNILKLKGGVK